MATQPCPCGRYNDASGECTCSPLQVRRYRGKVSGPLLDRIDLHVDVPAVKYADLTGPAAGESSGIIRSRVLGARQIQTKRFDGRKGVYCNADLGPKAIREWCATDRAGEEILKAAVSKLGLSARAFDRILKVARTIADLAGAESIRAEHIAEAVQYRSLDRGAQGG
ncbi:MAG TPA: ATP-binding protein [Bacteroidota bacterium]|nr:ATP-binding protein [Bacteroidota bacterium]